jgi:integrase/recombinase XerD
VLLVVFRLSFLIDLFFDSLCERSDSLRESNSFKEAFMGVLRERMIEEMKLRNFSPATQESYVYAVSRLAKYHNQSPDQLSKGDIRAFLVHLTVERKLSPNSLTGYCSGLRFFYSETLGWDETKLFIPPRKKPSVLPEVFSADEVMRLIGAARGLNVFY